MADVREDQNTEEQLLDQLIRKPRYASSREALNDMRLRLKEDGVDILRQCSAGEKEPCWLRGCLAVCNKILHTASLQITESADRGLVMEWVFVTTPNDADTLQADFLKDWLLSRHSCIHTVSRAGDLLSGCPYPGLRSVEASSVSGLGHVTALEHFSLFSATLTDASVEELADMLGRNHNLKSFKIVLSTVPESGSEKILAKLEGCPSLEAVELSYTSLSASAARVLAHLLRTSKSLKKLTMQGVDKECTKIALEGLHDGSSLEEINLFGLEPHESPFFMKYSEVFKNLKVVRLPCNDLDNASAFEFAALIEACETFVELSLNSNSFGDGGAVAIAKALRHNKTLRKLSLPQGQLTSTSLVEFVNALTVNTTLERLDVAEVDILEEHRARLFEDPKSAGAFKRIFVIWKQKWLKDLAALLRRNDHMPQVYVDVDPGVPPADLDAFFDALLASHTVTEVSFYPKEFSFDHLVDRLAALLRGTTTIRAVYHRLSPDEKHEETHLVRLLDALRDNTSVADFTTYVSYLTVPMGVALGKLLEVNNTLTTLTLCEYWSVDPEVARTLANSMRHNYTLLDLRIESDAEDVEGLPEVWEALRRNKALLYPAAEFVTGEAGDERPAEALRKVHRSWALVEEVMRRTGKREAEVRQYIADALSRLGAS
ncbi:protein NLRC3-like [Ixodes scapularis]|uniref:protein NLRC3-like n=1 Tax=Ixodes scapularis TaxID=6945 RepID=UPI001C3936BA|nr:protein NLRC3-like [Ixodes scapularis]